MVSIGLRCFSAALIVSLLLQGFGMQAVQPCLAPDAIWRVHSVGDPQMAPDGRSVIYVASRNDVMDDLSYSNLRQVSIDGTGDHAVTEGKYHDSSPRWSPDGNRIAYISNRGDRQAVHVLTLATGAEWTIAAGTEGLSNLAWSPDGKLLAYMAFVASAPAWAPAMPPQPPGAHWAPAAVAVTSLRWTFDGLGVLKPGATRIFVVPAGGGTPLQLSRDPFQHTFYLADPELVWSGDSKLILAPAVNAPDGWAVYEGNQIYGFPLDGGVPQQLTHIKGYGLQVRPSPDGSRIAFTGYDWKGHSYHVSRLYVMDMGGEPREITTGWDRDVSMPVWSEDSNRIYFLSDDRGDVNLYETGIDGGVKKVTTGRHHLASLSMAGGLAAVIYSTPKQPPALATVMLDAPEKVTIIADANRKLMTGCKLSEAEEIWYKSFDERRIQGWILKPRSSTRRGIILYWSRCTAVRTGHMATTLTKICRCSPITGMWCYL